jgi:GNAT superfamily N-acetyltransferase
LTKDQLRIAHIDTNEQILTVRSLFLEYWNSFGFDLAFQNFSDEIAALPGRYARPAGRLALATFGDVPAGCIALRRLDERRCEAKRLYVRTEFRGQGIASELLKWVIDEARAAGYSELVGDTMPSMSHALAMYERVGFRRVPPYASEPTPGAIYLSLNLTS